MWLKAFTLLILLCGLENLCYGPPACRQFQVRPPAISASTGATLPLTNSETESIKLGDPRSLANPAASGSIAPNLTAAPGGRAALSWLEPCENGLALRFSIRDQHGWSKVQTVVERSNFDKYAEAPPWVLMLSGGTILAVWAEQLPGSGKWPGNFLYAAVSREGANKWSTPVVVHSDRSNSEHSFSSIAATGADRAAVIWLDAREYANKNRYHLMAATIAASGEVSGEQSIDDDVCTCCPTALAATPDGLAAVYRDHTPSEIRDVGIVRQAGGQWQRPGIVHQDGWHIKGCPVNGPALSSRGEDLAAAWFTGAHGEPTVSIAFSHDSGKTFPKRIILDSPIDARKPVGRPRYSCWTAHAQSWRGCVRAALERRSSSKRCLAMTQQAASRY